MYGGMYRGRGTSPGHDLYELYRADSGDPPTRPVQKRGGESRSRRRSILPRTWNHQRAAESPCSRGLKLIRIARAVNGVLERGGRVFADRYHAHQLRSPTETANAIAYVLGNAMIHAARHGQVVDPDAVDFLTSYAHRQLVAQARTWLLRIGWTLAPPILPRR